MIDWHKLQPLYERKAYRIVQKHIKAILAGIPYQKATTNTWEMLVRFNITEDQINKMFVDICSTIGLNYGNRINKELERTKKAHILFNEYLLNEILLFLSNPELGGSKIVSVHNTLVEEVIKAVQAQLGENATVIEIQNAIFNIVSKSQTFYKWQALRIARTETTFASGFAAMKTAEQSDLVMTKTWISAVDNRTRHDHLQENGQSVDLEEDFIMADGTKIGFPGALGSKEHPVPAHQVINCRCTIGFTAKRDSDGELIMKK